MVQHSGLLLVVSLVLGILCPANARADELPTKVTQFPDGRIIFPVMDAQAGADGEHAWRYKPTRWGMYDLEVISAEATGNRATIEVAGRSFPVGDFRSEGGVHSGRVTRFYLAKAEPFDLRLQTESGKISAVVFRPAPEGNAIVQEGADIVLKARDAVTHSVMMRYEPATNKNCLGFWTNPKDSASWTFRVTQPGTYELELWQGCGKGQGGSEVQVQVLKPLGSGPLAIKEARFTVEETGHFQNFIPRALGELAFRIPGEYTLAVQPINKKAAAVMDIRQIVLRAKDGRQSTTSTENPNTRKETQ